MIRCTLLAAAMTLALTASGPGPLTLDEAGRLWVSRQLESLSLEQKAGQLLMPASRTRPSELAPARSKNHLQLVERYSVGGWLALGGEMPAARRLVEKLQDASEIPLLVAVDGEGGLGYRLTGATRFPRAMALAAGSTPDEIAHSARLTAREALATGIHVSFYPVVDVNTNPENPIISIRSFGDDPARVAELAAAYVRGLQEAGMLATAKHFPGHGDTSGNSHLQLPLVAGDRERLRSVELFPFRQLVDAGVGLVMTGHLAAPAIEADPEVPATLSRAAVTDLLRGEMGFSGLIVTDALNMRGLPLKLGAGEVAVRALEAGADLLLMPTSIPDAHAGLVQAVRQGRLDESRLDEAVERVLAAKAHLGLHKSPKTPRQVAIPEEHRLLARRLTQNAMTLVRDAPGLLPLQPARSERPLVVTAVSSSRSRGSRGAQWAAQIRARRPEASVQSVPSRFSRLSREVLLERARGSDLILLALHLRVADSVGRIALSEDQVQAVRQLLESKTPVATVVFGSPYLLGELPDLPTLVFAFEDHSEAERAAVRALFGEASFRGRLPVALPGIAPAGHGLIQ